MTILAPILAPFLRQNASPNLCKNHTTFLNAFFDDFAGSRGWAGGRGAAPKAELYRSRTESDIVFHTPLAPAGGQGAADPKANASAAGPLFGSLDVWRAGCLRTGELEEWRTGGQKDWRTGCLEGWEVLGLQNEVLGGPLGCKMLQNRGLGDLWAAK